MKVLYGELPKDLISCIWQFDILNQFTCISTNFGSSIPPPTRAQLKSESPQSNL